MSYLKIFISVVAMIGSLSAQDSKEDGLDENSPNAIEGKTDLKAIEQDIEEEDCWMNLDAASHFQIMNDLDKKYKRVLQHYHKTVGTKIDQDMLSALLADQGAAYRAAYKTDGNVNLIPAGLNLGGYSMMKMKDTVLFFYRMKLRNDTNFRVNSLQNDLVNMSLSVRMSLNDLHLVGAYERCATYHDSSILYHVPSYGEIEILLQNVSYKMEGRLRTIHDRLIIEAIDSELIIDTDVLLTYLHMHNTTLPTQVRKNNLEDFLNRMKADLDLWLMDYFNDYYMYYKLKEKNAEIIAYDKARTMALSEYSDFAINKIKQRLIELGAKNVKVPSFTIFSVPNLQINLTEGVVRGLDTMYRRSVSTGKRDGDIRRVDAIIGFSDLKVEYKFDATLPVGVPPLVGHLFLAADELTAHMGISMVKDPESIDLNFDFIQQIKPESLTVEGPANRLIASYKHILETHIIAIMISNLMYDIRMLSTLPRCQPSIYGYDDRQDHNSHEFSKGSHDDDDYVLFKNDSVELELVNPFDLLNRKHIELKRKQSFSLKRIDK